MERRSRNTLIIIIIIIIIIAAAHLCVQSKEAEEQRQLRLQRTTNMKSSSTRCAESEKVQRVQSRKNIF